MDSTSTQLESDAWLIDSGVSFLMTPHREWLYEYERYNWDVFLADDNIGDEKSLKLLHDNQLFIKRSKRVLGVFEVE